MSDRIETNASRFSRWLSARVSPGQISDFFLRYSEIEKHGYKIKLLKGPLLETTDLVLLSKLASEINHNKLFRFWHRKQINKMGLVMTLYISFIKEITTQKPHSASSEADKQTTIEIFDSSEYDSAFETKDTKRMDSDGSQEDAIGITTDAEASQTNDELHSIGEQSAESVSESATECTAHQNEGLTIRGAVAKVLSGNEVLLTAQQIYDRIVSTGLYEFGAKDPVSVIRTEINRACKGSNYSQKVSNIIFGSQLNEDGEREYYLLARESELPTKSSSSPMTIESNQESDARSCSSDESSESSHIPDSLTLADRLYLALSQECESNPFGTTAEYLAKVVAESAKDVKRILADVEWASYKYGKYTLVDSDANKELVYDYSKPKSLSFTKPICAVYFDEVVSSASTWRQLFIDVLRVLYDDYPSKIDSVVGQVFPSFVAPLIGTKEDVAMFRAPKEFVNGLFVEVNRSANDLISALIKLLEICDVDLENLVIKYERKQTKKSNSPKKHSINTHNNTYKKTNMSSAYSTSTENGGKENDIIQESWKKTIKQLEERYDVRLCYDYVSNPAHKRNDALYKANNGKKDVIWIYYIHSSRSHYVSIETEPEYLASIQGEIKGFTQIRLRDSHPRQKMKFNDFEMIQSSLLDICDSIDSFFAKSTAKSSVTDEPSPNETPSEILPLAESILIEADLEGLTIEELATRLNKSILSVKKLVQNSTNIVSICGKQIHKEAYMDWTVGANQMEIILNKLMDKNNGYVSDVQLYDYARVEMQMFLNDNDLDDQRKVFDLAEHLFDKERYHGKHYSFWLKTHISLDGEVITSKLDVMLKYARSMGGCFREEDLESYLQGLGIKTASLRQQMKVYDEPIFLVYQPGTFITAESMGINEEWLGKISNALSKLFADTGDHVVLRDIQPWWFFFLPDLPNRLPWTPLLLQSVLLHYGERLGAHTIYAIAGQAIDILHVMVVSNDSEIQTFADAVIATLLENNNDKRSFSIEELRRILIQHGLIAENEMLWNMPKALPNDDRFAWDVDGQHVTIRI